MSQQAPLLARVVVTVIGLLLAIPVSLHILWRIVSSPVRALKRVDRAAPPLRDGFSRRMLKLDTGVRLSCVEAGPASARETVLFLHGFPECSHSWRHQMAALSTGPDAKRCVAIDQRGYALSDKPPAVADYHIARLAADVAATIRALGRGSVHLVGHDWGGAVAWETSQRFEELLLSVTILNSPHPRLVKRNRGLKQAKKSYYMALFQVPLVPELWMGLNDYAGVVAGLKRDMVCRDSVPSKEDLDAFKFAVSRPRALTSMINWYRAMLSAPPPKSEGIPDRSRKPLSIPVLVVWGTEDKYLGFELMDGLSEVATDSRIVPLRASHWVQQECPDKVNDELRKFYTMLAKRG
jgi:pimeloyl-ACP methyl ester carboxylesterase